MSEPRKNHLSIDGGQVKEDDNVASYKAIPESDTEFRTSKSNLSKSKEKVSDEAEEKLLHPEEKVVCVDMADAKYVVGDHRNGDAKIELDANKRQFSGLTKEELLKYADDPFWVRLRWFMFVLFWALWFCMLAGAIAIIVRSSKCSPPPPKTWFEKGPLVDMSSLDTYAEIEEQLPLLQSNKVQGIFIDVPPTYEALDEPNVVEQFKSFIEKAKSYGVKVIVDLTPNFVSDTSRWFALSANRSAEFDSYFVWAKSKEFIDGSPKPPNNWVSTLNTPAWSWHEGRQEFYLHQYREDQPDLNFTNPAVVQHFDDVLKTWMKAGADGVRLIHVRQLLVNDSLPDEKLNTGHGSSPGSDHTMYAYWRHQHTTDQPGLDDLLARWSTLVDSNGATPDAGETVFTMLETRRPELFLLRRNATYLRPRSAAAVPLTDAHSVADMLKLRLGSWPAVHTWPAIQLTSEDNKELEIAELAMLLPAAPVLQLDQLNHSDNDTVATGMLSHLAALREDASVQHGYWHVAALPAVNSTVNLLVCARWKTGHTGYVAVLNPTEEEAAANLTLPSVPPSLTVHHVSQLAVSRSSYTNHASVSRENVMVPPSTTVVLSYVPEVDEK